MSTRITLVAGVAIFIGFSVMIALISTFSYQSTLEQGQAVAREQSAAFADDVSSKLEQGMTVTGQLANTVAGIRKVVTPDRKQMTAVLIETLKRQPDAIGVWMVWEPNAFDGNDAAFRFDWPQHDPTGRFTPYVVRSGGQIKMDVMTPVDEIKTFEQFRANPETYQPFYEKSPDGDFYLQPKKRKQDTLTEPFFYSVDGQQVLESSLVTAVVDDAGRFLGVVGIDLALSDLQKEFGAVRIHDSGYLTVLSEGGLYVVSQDAQQLGKPVASGSVLAAHLAKVKQGAAFSYEEGAFTHFYQPISIGKTGQFWSVGVSIPTAAITEAAVTQRNLAILIGGVALLVIITLLAWLVRRQTAALNVLADSMEQLASGKGDLTARIEVSNRDEIGRTADAFNRFLASLRDMFIEVREQSLAVSTGTRQISEAVERVEQASTSQSDAASATAASVEQVTVSVQQIAQISADAEQLAEENGQLSRSSVDAVSRVSAEVSQVNQTMQSLSERMDELGQRSQEVSTIVRVIQDIADQTNLLALNAAIEAARAGESGRGFAVVADEVRNLAGRTASATVEIARIVSAIGKETRDAVADVELTRSQVSNSVAIAGEANQAILDISARNGQLLGRVGEIAASTREQSSASSEIARNVEQISSMAQSNSEIVIEVGGALDELREMAGRLETMVGSFKV
ncbi:methyl-accepting chemotaxis protein [Craterilacuibacter sp.]|uniref:methyl-accepting chemotaxis protein n=1 Tax=Craterilacuibacter sp. TaxID=2870909 RepID=UPI003F2A7612